MIKVEKLLDGSWLSTYLLTGWQYRTTIDENNELTDQPIYYWSFLVH